jgi:hypothetical protein
VATADNPRINRDEYINFFISSSVNNVPAKIQKSIFFKSQIFDLTLYYFIKLKIVFLFATQTNYGRK